MGRFSGRNHQAFNCARCSGHSSCCRDRHGIAGFGLQVSPGLQASLQRSLPGPQGSPLGLRHWQSSGSSWGKQVLQGASDPCVPTCWAPTVADLASPAPAARHSPTAQGCAVGLAPWHEDEPLVFRTHQPWKIIERAI